jgi:very-short-patch-repair endonuclease
LREALEERRALEAAITLSVLEDAFLRLLRDANLPIPATNAHIGGFQVDAVWRAHRIAVELDGWASHHTRSAFEHDRERDAKLTASGWRVIRFTHHQVIRRPDRVIETLRRLDIR